MSQSLQGTIQRIGLGAGTWALVTADGTAYELHQGAPDSLLHVGLTVKVQGKIREDVMTFAMVGPVLEVESFEILADSSG